MVTPALFEQFTTIDTKAAQLNWLRAHAADIDDQFIEELKTDADIHLRSDLAAATAAVQSLYVAASFTGNPLHRALALFADANVAAIGGRGDYPRAIDCCNEAAAIFAHARCPVDQADAQVTKIYALAMLGRYEEALQAGTWAAAILIEQSEWLRLATIEMNVAIVYGRMGKDHEALDYFNRANEHYLRAGPEGHWSLPGVAMNRALILRNLGRFTESLAANHTAIQQLTQLGQRAEVGHAQQTMAFTYYTLGHYNQALLLLDQAEATFAHDERQSDLLVNALYRCHCLLEMQRYAAVIAQSDVVTALAMKLGQPFEHGYALLNKARAYAGLHQEAQALDLLTAARTLFMAQHNLVWVAESDMVAAQLLLKLTHLSAADERASHAVHLFTERQLPAHQARAQLLVAEVQLATGNLPAATHQLIAVAHFADEKELPTLAYRAAHLQGQVAIAENKLTIALRHYEQAINSIERLRGRLMVEHRADFLSNKEAIYNAAIQLALALGVPAAAHTYADRARSRALHDLLTLRIDLHVQAKHERDEALVVELNQLRQARDEHYRRTLHASDFAAVIDHSVTAGKQTTASNVWALEEEIAQLWHTLLMRNADYLDDQSLAGEWSNRSFDEHYFSRVQASVPDDTLMVSYYCTERTTILFLVGKATLHATELPVALPQLQRLAELLRLNIDMAAASTVERLPALTSHAQKILHQLYQLLLAPVQANLAGAKALVIVPHGILHYLPFHAFVCRLDLLVPNQSRYLLDEFTVSYLPSAAMRPGNRLMDSAPHQAASWAVFGHTYKEQLPHVLPEVQAIGALAGAAVYTEAKATKAQVFTAAATARLLHLATHGEFRADNPLFSGLALDDGWLSTLDIFTLKTQASLVTLSACQTGRNLIGGGDELQGLTRAFLAAGAASLVLSLWSVHDASTAELMVHFYRALLAGMPKSAALRTAQVTLRHQTTSTNSDTPYAHPYFWAPFFLIGDTGPL